MCNMQSLKDKSLRFHSLHSPDAPLLLLPNAWDCLSAKLFESEGAAAIGTTSAGIAATFGYADGQVMPKELFLAASARIVNSVSVPVTVDIEAGYGYSVEEVADTAKQVRNHNMQ